MWNLFSRTSRNADASADLEKARAERAALRAASSALEVTSPPGGGPVSPPGVVGEIATIERIGSITVITLIPSELTEFRGGPELADLLEELVVGDHRYLVFDIQNVMFMDSRCIGCLVQAMNELVLKGGKSTGIALANPRSSVAHLFRITRLDRIFPICNDVLAAVNVLERRIESASG
jgi:anti-sigma B factor antagonist